MATLLKLFQIKSRRSAQMFLFGSIVILLYEVYWSIGFFADQSMGSSLDNDVLLIVIIGMIPLTSLYIALACWALFSDEGIVYLETQEQQTNNKSFMWFIKFFFACFVAGFATAFAMILIMMPFEDRLGDLFKYMNMLLFAFGLLWAPIIYKRLR